MTVLRDASFLISMLHIIILLLLLFEPRFSWRITILSGLFGCGAMLSANVLLMYWKGHGIIMGAAFLTCTIPSFFLFLLLSKYRDGRFFFLFCLTDTICFWLLQATNFLDRLTGNTYVVLLISRLIVFPIVEYLLWRYLRRPFLELQSKLSKGWWLFAIMGLIYYLLVMFTAIPVDAPMPDASGLAVACLVMSLMPLTYLTILHSLWRQMRFYENTRQMELQRRDYEAIRQKMELGRIYRHDMRHHLAALESMLQQGDASGAQQYVHTLSGGLEQTTRTARCANSAVNAVLTAYLDQAASAGCQVEAKVLLPESLPFEETDLCVVLANPLENAIHACQQLPEEQRRIKVELELTDNQRLIISMENPCPQPVEFGANGLPSLTKEEGHGLGLQSVQSVTDKYGGLLRCQWEDGNFMLRTVLIPPSAQRTAPAKPALSRITLTILCVLISLILLNVSPALADVLESIPLLGNIIRVVDLRTYSLLWKGSELTVQQPQAAGGESTPAPGAEDFNASAEDFITQMQEQFIWYADRRFEGHTGMDIGYNILRDDDALLVVQFYATVNVGGSADYVRHVVLDKSSGAILSLSNLFTPGSGYVELLSQEVLAQMEQAVGEGAPYFIPGQGWPEKDCFQAIDPDQDFYIDSQNQLVLVFEEYTVAPGSMGSPEFTIPTQTLEGCLAQPSPLKRPSS